MIFDRYELIEPIGSGGMATVWKAVDHSLDRQVAIKRLAPHLASDPTAAARFKREAQAAARLSHPGIVTVFDTGEDSEGPFIVLELIEGQTLADKLRNDGPLAAPIVAQMVRQAAEALDHAHSNGIIHRDLKPANLIVEDNGSVRLTDFGIARVVDDVTTITDQGDLVGTIAYIAPEILEGEPATPASDIYSLGAVTYEMLSGTAPFRGDNIAALMAAIRAGGVPRLDAIDETIANAVSQAMALDPAERPATAGAFATSLIAGTTLPLDPGPIVPVVPPSLGPVPGEPTLVLPAAATGPPEANRRRWVWIAGPALLAVAALVAAAMFAAGDPTLPGTTTPTAADPTTTGPAATTSTIVVTTPVETPDMVAAAIAAALEDLRPPENKPKDVRKVGDELAKLMEEWTAGDVKDLDHRFDEILKALEKLPPTPERDAIVAMVVHLAETMGLEIEPSLGD